MWQRLQLLKPFWWIVAGLCVLCLIVLFVSAIAVDQSNVSALAVWLRDVLVGIGLSGAVNEIGPFVSNDLIAGALIGGLSATLSAAIIQIFKIPAIRQTAIRAIAFGYYENFLKKLVAYANANHRIYRIGIIMPRFELVSQPDVYWEGVKTQIALMGFSTRTEETDASFGRNTFIIYREAKKSLPVYIDVPTTTRTLQEILELEADMPVGKSRNTNWFKRRFEQLRNEFGAALRDYYPEDALPNLVFITPTSQTDFETQLSKLIADLEADLAKLPDDED